MGWLNMAVSYFQDYLEMPMEKAYNFCQPFGLWERSCTPKLAPKQDVLGMPLPYILNSFTQPSLLLPGLFISWPSSPFTDLTLSTPALFLISVFPPWLQPKHVPWVPPLMIRGSLLPWQWPSGKVLCFFLMWDPSTCVLFAWGAPHYTMVSDYDDLKKNLTYSIPIV